MTAIRFAARNLLRQPGRTTLGILGIAAVGALLFDMLLLSRGLVVSFRDLLDSVGFDIRVAASESALPAGFPIAGASAAVAAIGALPEVKEAVAVRSLEGDVGLGEGVLTVSVLAIDPGGLRPWTIIAGRDLDGGPGPAVVLNQNLSDRLRQPIGAALSLRLLCDRNQAAPLPRTFTLAGVAQFPFDGQAQLTALIPRSDLRDICGERGDDADLLMVASREDAGTLAAVRTIRSLRPDLAVLTNEQLGEIAALRALGFSARRAAADVFCQGAMMVTVGGLLALPLGLLLSLWLDDILKAMPGIPTAMHFFVFEPRALAWHIGLLVATAVLASAYPMWIVARLPIATTLRNEVVS